MHPIVCLFLPSYWKGKSCLRRSIATVTPEIEQLLRSHDAGTWRPMDTEEGPNLMSWLIDLAKGNDREPAKIAHLQLLISFASVHTVLVRILNVLYDIVANPELVQDLEDEIHAIANSDTGWADAPYERLYKLDSVIRESQRMSPPGGIGVKRVFQTQYTFQDGLNIPKGTYVCLPALAIEHDPYFYPNPHVFDGLRSYRSYMEANKGGGKQNANQFRYTTTGRTNMSFGHGKNACPGRFFASLAVKMVMVKLLTEYDFKFLPGTIRPSNLMLHEFIVISPSQKILVRRKNKGMCPF